MLLLARMAQCLIGLSFSMPAIRPMAILLLLLASRNRQLAEDGISVMPILVILGPPPTWDGTPKLLRVVLGVPFKIFGSFVSSGFPIGQLLRRKSLIMQLI